MNIKPIETFYNGYRFRSRLEARWAVFFDAAGIKYQYEPEGFEANGFKYLPDFYFPDFNLYGEVKGKPFTKEEKEKMAWNIGCCGPLKDGLVFFGNIPPDSVCEEIYDYNLPAVKWNGGIEKCIAGFWLNGTKKLKIEISEFDNDEITYAPEFPYNDAEIMDFCAFGDDVDEWIPHKDLARKFLAKARRARFEYGESG